MKKELILCLMSLALGLSISGVIYLIASPLDVLDMLILGLSVGIFVGYVTERG